MFSPKRLPDATTTYNELKLAAEAAKANRERKKAKKKGKQEGLFNQVHKTIALLLENPRHNSLHTHEFDSIKNPFDPTEKVRTAYAQNNTPGTYRVFWCCGPEKGQITIIAITPHP